MNYMYDFPIIESINLLFQKQTLGGPLLFKDIAFLSSGFWSSPPPCHHHCSPYPVAPCLFPLQRLPLFLPSPWGFAAIFSGFHKLVLLPPHSDPLFLWPHPCSHSMMKVSVHLSKPKIPPYLIFRSVLFLSVLRQGSFVTHFHSRGHAVDIRIWISKAQILKSQHLPWGGSPGVALPGQI